MSERSSPLRCRRGQYANGTGWFEYQTARKAFLEAPSRPDGIYIPCGGWGTMHNIEPLEQDLDSTVVTWMNAMIWSSMKRCKVTGPIAGFGKLLATL